MRELLSINLEGTGANSLECTPPLHNSQTRQAHLVIGIDRISNPTGRQSWIFEPTHPTDPRLSSDLSIRFERSIAFVPHYHNTPYSRSSVFIPSVNRKNFNFHLENHAMLPGNRRFDRSTVFLPVAPVYYTTS